MLSYWNMLVLISKWKFWDTLVGTVCTDYRIVKITECGFSDYFLVHIKAIYYVFPVFVLTKLRWQNS